MKKIIIFTMLMLLAAAAAVCAAPGYEEQISLIAANSDLWKQDYEYVQWGYVVTDLDKNGRLEIISCSVQGTGFYSYIQAFEVNEDSTGLTDLLRDLKGRTDSAPDIMANSVPFYYDKENDRYYYIFDDMIRNGMAEYYENKRAVSIRDGIWEEIPLANKSTLYTDAEHYTVTCTDQDGKTISEEEFETIAETVYKDLESGEINFGWEMTDTNDFNALTEQQIIENLGKSLDSGSAK